MRADPFAMRGELPSVHLSSVLTYFLPLVTGWVRSPKIPSPRRVRPVSVTRYT